MTTRRDVMLGGAALAASAAMPTMAADAPSPLGTSQTALGHYLRALRAKDGGKIDPIEVVDYVHGLGGVKQRPAGGSGGGTEFAQGLGRATLHQDTVVFQ